MPIYTYKCNSCGFSNDVLQKLSDPVLTDCPSCKQPSLAKQVTAAGFQLKGSGWYATDFKGGNKATPASPAASTEAGSASAEASKTTPPASPAGGCAGACACHP